MFIDRQGQQRRDGPTSPAVASSSSLAVGNKGEEFRPCSGGSCHTLTQGGPAGHAGLRSPGSKALPF